MRETARIKRILNKLEFIWSKDTDSRFNQLITNLNWGAANQDCFYIEDEKFENILDIEIEKIKNGK